MRLAARRAGLNDDASVEDSTCTIASHTAEALGAARVGGAVPDHAVRFEMLAPVGEQQRIRVDSSAAAVEMRAQAETTEQAAQQDPMCEEAAVGP